MESIFKYRSNFKRDLKSLISNEIYFPSIMQLNDSFEGFVDNRDFKKLLKFSEEKFGFGIDSKLERSECEIGVFSTSKTLFNNVLWSHYSNNHQGFVIEYNLKNLLISLKSENDTLVKNFRIKYRKNPPKNLVFTHDSEDNTLDTKSTEWEYEQEYRITVDKYGFYKITRDCIKSIIFGANCKSRNINYARNLLKKNNINGISLYQLKKNEGQFLMKKELI